MASHRLFRISNQKRDITIDLVRQHVEVTFLQVFAFLPVLVFLKQIEHIQLDKKFLSFAQFMCTCSICIHAVYIMVHVGLQTISCHICNCQCVLYFSKECSYIQFSSSTQKIIQYFFYVIFLRLMAIQT